MSIKTKILLSVGVISWLALIVEALCLELADILFRDIAVLMIITFLVVIGSLAYFVWEYVRNKKEIIKIRQEYLDSFKPEKPLRYCPSDEELLDKYKKGIIKDKDLEVLKSEKLTNLAKAKLEEKQKENEDEELVME